MDTAGARPWASSQRTKTTFKRLGREATENWRMTMDGWFKKYTSESPVETFSQREAKLKARIADMEIEDNTATPERVTIADVLKQLTKADARIAELEAAQGWRPIADDQKDGRTILAYFPLDGLSDDYFNYMPVYWSEREDRWNFSGRVASGFSRSYQPTHFFTHTPPPTE